MIPQNIMHQTVRSFMPRLQTNFFSFTAQGRLPLICGFAALLSFQGVRAQDAAPATPPAAPPAPAPITAPAGTPDFGPNVIVFDPSNDPTAVQAQCDTIFNQQQSNQFGDARYALLFKPGSYNVKVNVGFYTQVYGLGQMPDDTTLTGGFNCDAKWMNGNGTDNFWRGVENLAAGDATPKDEMMWAVSQAVPLRRVHVKGKMVLFQPNGKPNWASGGYMADCVVDGKIVSGSQQQWFARNSTWASWSNGVWNMVFLGDTNPPQGTWPQKPYTTIDKTPVIAEKPFLFIDKDNSYKVFVPALLKDTTGPSWVNNQVQGKAIPLSQFYIARSDKDDATSINAALDKGQNLLLTPGIYKLDAALKVTHPNTVVLGIGMPTLSPQKGTGALEVADVSGVRIACVLLDAGSVNSPYLMQVGDVSGKASHADNPTILYDIFARIGGGADLGIASTAVVINSSDVIVDHSWLWRADHGNQVGWDSNKSANGLVVNGDNVTTYGLFVEHFQQDITQWNGENGRTYFYQCELPYDPPTQDAWQQGISPKINGWPGYRVADYVKVHEAWGLGVYAFFHNEDGIMCENAYEVPQVPGVKIHDACVFGSKDKSGINTIVNGVGNSTVGANKNKVQRLEEYPAPVVPPST